MWRQGGGGAPLTCVDQPIDEAHVDGDKKQDGLVGEHVEGAEDGALEKPREGPVLALVLCVNVLGEFWIRASATLTSCLGALLVGMTHPHRVQFGSPFFSRARGHMSQGEKG